MTLAIHVSKLSPFNVRFIVSSYPNLITARNLEGIDEDFELNELNLFWGGAVLFNPISHEWSIIEKLECFKTHDIDGNSKSPFLYKVSCN